MYIYICYVYTYTDQAKLCQPGSADCPATFQSSQSRFICNDPDELDAKIQEMVDHDGPVIFDCLVTKAENCFPMIPSGAAHNEMLLGSISGDEIDEEGRKLV